MFHRQHIPIRRLDPRSASRLLLAASLVLAAGRPAGSRAVDPTAVTITSRPDGLAIAIGGRPFAIYVFEDGATTRPFFKDLHAPDGTRVTRNFPPVEGKDRTDHATMHPGLWMAFGDLGGADSWRNRDRIRHAGFVEEPRSRTNRGWFVVRNLHEREGKPFAEEVARLTILADPGRNLLLWDSTFRPLDGPLAFGDQEEMGLAIRMATPLAVLKGGRITNSDGLKDEAQVWGKAADWCAYGGSVGGFPVEVVLMNGPDNFRRPWFHARDYGLLVANPFGRQALSKGEKSEVRVAKGESLRLRFGVAITSGPDASAASSFRAYRRAIGAGD